MIKSRFQQKKDLKKERTDHTVGKIKKIEVAIVGLEEELNNYVEERVKFVIICWLCIALVEGIFKQ